MKFFFSKILQAEGLQLYQKYIPLPVFSKIFLQICSIYKAFLEILQTYSSQKTLK